jgi:prevent-host-death family protein
MPKNISVSEAKNIFSAMLRWAEKSLDEVIIESHGQPKAAIVTYAEYEIFQMLREKERRQKAIERLQALAAENQSLNQELTSAEAKALADEITRETIERMVKEGKVSFQQL